MFRKILPLLCIAVLVGCRTSGQKSSLLELSGNPQIDFENAIKTVECVGQVNGVWHYMYVKRDANLVPYLISETSEKLAFGTPQPLAQNPFPPAHLIFEERKVGTDIFQDETTGEINLQNYLRFSADYKTAELYLNSKRSTSLVCDPNGAIRMGRLDKAIPAMKTMVEQKYPELLKHAKYRPGHCYVGWPYLVTGRRQKKADDDGEFGLVIQLSKKERLEFAQAITKEIEKDDAAPGHFTVFDLTEALGSKIKAPDYFQYPFCLN